MFVPVNRIYTLFSSLSIAVRFIVMDKMALVRILCETSLCSVSIMNDTHPHRNCTDSYGSDLC